MHASLRAQQQASYQQSNNHHQQQHQQSYASLERHCSPAEDADYSNQIQHQYQLPVSEAVSLNLEQNHLNKAFSEPELISSIPSIQPHTSEALSELVYQNDDEPQERSHHQSGSTAVGYHHYFAEPAGGGGCDGHTELFVAHPLCAGDANNHTSYGVNQLDYNNYHNIELSKQINNLNTYHEPNNNVSSIAVAHITESHQQIIQDLQPAPLHCIDLFDRDTSQHQLHHSASSVPSSPLITPLTHQSIESATHNHAFIYNPYLHHQTDQTLDENCAIFSQLSASDNNFNYYQVEHANSVHTANADQHLQRYDCQDQNFIILKPTSLETNDKHQHSTGLAVQSADCGSAEQHQQQRLPSKFQLASPRESIPGSRTPNVYPFITTVTNSHNQNFSALTQHSDIDSPHSGSIQSDESASTSTRDERRAKEAKIPLSYNEIVNLSIDQFNDKLVKYDLTESQLTLIKDIRRRGKNKVAAQSCRKRKMDQIFGLQREVDQLRHRREAYQSKYARLNRIFEQVSQRYHQVKHIIEAANTFQEQQVPSH